MDDRPRQVLKQLLGQYGPGLCNQPGRCRGLLLDALRGACEAEVNTLLLMLQYGIVQDLRAAVGIQPPGLLLPRLVQKLRRKVPLDESATRWAIEVWAEVLIRCLLPPPPLPPPIPSPLSSRPSSPPPSRARQTPGRPPLQLPLPVVPFPPPPSNLPPIWRNSIGIEFVLIHAGEFRMGSHDGPDDEQPLHAVCIGKPFYLGRYEVTQGQWQIIMRHNRSRFQGDATLPVERVSWEDAQEFLRRLNVKEGASTYRLPTEAEWEYAARAGTTTIYSFGNDARQLEEYAWYRKNAGDHTHPVGQKKLNAWGLYDRHGNVWEWVQDWYGAYSAGAVVNPEGPSTGSDRVRRGGSWYDAASSCRSAYRYEAAPSRRIVNVGFRLLRMVS